MSHLHLPLEQYYRKQPFHGFFLLLNLSLPVFRRVDWSRDKRHCQFNKTIRVKIGCADLNEHLAERQTVTCTAHNIEHLVMTLQEYSI